MATLLAQYENLRQTITAQIEAGTFPSEQVLQHQELLYRISILETCMTFSRTAPVTTDQRVLGFHYQVLDAFIQSLLVERKLGLPPDQEQKQKRETAHANFERVVTAFRKQFSSFNPSSQDVYRHSIQNMLNTILPAWMAYRNTYVSL